MTFMLAVRLKERQRQAHPDWGKVKPDTTRRLSGSNPQSPVCVSDFLSICLAKGVRGPAVFSEA